MDRDLLEKLIGRIKKKTTNFGDMNHEIHWDWNGMTTASGNRAKHMRDRNSIPQLRMVFAKPYPLVKNGNKRMSVQRLVFEYYNPEVVAENPDYRLRNICGNTLCIHPKHWKKNEKVSDEEEALFQVPNEEVSELQFCEADLDVILARDIRPRHWLDVRSDPQVASYSDEVLRATLLKMKRSHLLP